MPTERLTDDTWRSVTLATDEIWQCREGQVLTSLETPTDPASDQGILLSSRDVRYFGAGQTVHYRRLRPEGVASETRVCRELTV